MATQPAFTTPHPARETLAGACRIIAHNPAPPYLPTFLSAASVLQNSYQSPLRSEENVIGFNCAPPRSVERVTKLVHHCPFLGVIDGVDPNPAANHTFFAFELELVHLPAKTLQPHLDPCHEQFSNFTRGSTTNSHCRLQSYQSSGSQPRPRATPPPTTIPHPRTRLQQTNNPRPAPI